MRENRNDPAVNGAVSEKHRAGAEAILLPTVADFPERIPLRPETDARLERLAEGLILDVVSPRQFVGGLAAFYWAAYDGQAWAEANRADARAWRLEYERDVWYWVAHNPGKKPGDLYRATTNRLWAEAVTR
jgi:hypothetical protein